MLEALAQSQSDHTTIAIADQIPIPSRLPAPSSPYSSTHTTRARYAQEDASYHVREEITKQEKKVERFGEFRLNGARAVVSFET